jgi:aspartate-semialdehyde dehydrogenase
MKVAVVGATGLVGSKMCKVLEERHFNVGTFIPVASEKSKGMEVLYHAQKYPVYTLQEALEMNPDLALFSAGGAISLEWAPKFAAAGTTVIDNSSAWRMDPDKKLIVPEINGHVLQKTDKIIANPNCSTIQMVMVLKPLMDAFGLEEVIVTTYQSVSGSGQKGVKQLLSEEKGSSADKFYPHPIFHNLIPQVDSFLENGFTKEELKMVNETHKILGNTDIHVNPTCVRVPVVNCHSESLYIVLKKETSVNYFKSVLESMPGVVVMDDPASVIYPQPLSATESDEVYVGRIRRDMKNPLAYNCWVVSDNLRKGAATNAVQIAEYLRDHHLL